MRGEFRFLILLGMVVELILVLEWDGKEGQQGGEGEGGG